MTKQFTNNTKLTWGDKGHLKFMDKQVAVREGGGGKGMDSIWRIQEQTLKASNGYIKIVSDFQNLNAWRFTK